MYSISWKVRRLYSGFLPGAPGGLPTGRAPLIFSWLGLGLGFGLGFGFGFGLGLGLGLGRS